jgi:hypothetical protein
LNANLEDAFLDVYDKLEDGFLDVYGYSKSIEAVCRRLDDINLKYSEEVVVLTRLTGLPPSLGTKRTV